MLLRLLREAFRTPKPHHSIVLALSSTVPLRHEFQLLGVDVFTLKEITTDYKKLSKFIKLLLKSPLSSIQCWMYHTFVFSVFFKFFFFKAPIIWHVRHGLGEINSYKFNTKWIIKFSSILSNFIPDKIVYNSLSAKLKHTEFGYNDSRAIYIANGFEVEKCLYRPIEKSVIPTFGVVGRIHHDKGQKELLEYLLERQSELLAFKFIFIGDGAQELGFKYKNKIKIMSMFSFMDSVENQSKIYENFDCLILPSLKEAFPNVLVEAMLYTKGFIGFKVGDVEQLSINKIGLVEPGNYQELLEKIKKYDTSYHLNRKQFQALVKKFNIIEITKEHMKLW
jgi:glycosyltransferase involved in cell wall biosynthesis